MGTQKRVCNNVTSKVVPDIHQDNNKTYVEIDCAGRCIFVVNSISPSIPSLLKIL